MNVQWAQTREVLRLVVSSTADNDVPTATEITTEPWGPHGPVLVAPAQWVRSEAQPGGKLLLTLRKEMPSWWDRPFEDAKNARVQIYWSQWTDEETQLNDRLKQLDAIDDTYTDEEKARRLQQVIDILRDSENPEIARRRAVLERRLRLARDNTQ